MAIIMGDNLKLGGSFTSRFAGLSESKFKGVSGTSRCFCRIGEMFGETSKMFAFD
jgi:hypothetical protein